MKTKIISFLSAFAMLISMFSVFAVPYVAEAAWDGDSMLSAGLVDTSSFVQFSSIGAQSVIDLHYSEVTKQGGTYSLATEAAAKTAGGTYFTPTSHFLDFYTLPTTGYRWKMKAGSYKISSVDEMNLLAELSNCGIDFSGVEFYLASDIDFNWEPFRGICIGHSMIGRLWHESSTKYVNGTATNVYSEARRPANPLRPFNGVFDGNGFVIKNLYLVANDSPYVGLFGWTYAGENGNVIIRNVGIASGLVAGQESTGAIAGEAQNTKIINCWSAATVFGGGNNGTGGLVGRLVTGKSLVQNCYNLGMVYQWNALCGGIVGWRNDGWVKNTYNWGQIIHGIAGNNSQTHSAIMRKAGDKEGKGSNLYFRNGCIHTGTSHAAYNKINSAWRTENAVGIDATAENVSMLCGSNYLNSGISSSEAHGWTVAFKDLGIGYPVLTYTKDGKTISRVAQTDMIGENHWGVQNDCDLMALIYELNMRNNGVGDRMNHVEIRSANDLFILGMITTFQSLPIKSISLEADIDMAKEFTLIPGLKSYVPLYSGWYQTTNFSNTDYAVTPDIKEYSGTAGGKDHVRVSDGNALYCAGAFESVASMKASFDGKYHEIQNWHVNYMGRYYSRGGALIHQTGKGAVIKNLGLINASASYDATNTVNRYISYKMTYNESTKTYSVDSGTYKCEEYNYNYASLLVGLGYNAIVENCFTTGNLTVLNMRADTENNDSGIVARTWNSGGSVQDCWTDCTITKPDGKSPKRVRAIGSAYAEDDAASDVYLADTAWSGTPNELPTGYLIYNNVYYIGDSANGVDGAEFSANRNPTRQMPYLHIAEAAGTSGKKYKIDVAYFLNYQMKQKFMFTYNESDGTIHFAEPIIKNGEYVLNEETGYPTFSNPTRKVLYALTAQNGDWICAMDYQYANAGTTVTRKDLENTPHTGFTFNQAVSTLGTDNIVSYAYDPIVAYAAADSATAFNMLLTYYETLDGSDHMAIFENATYHRYVYQMAKNINAIADATQKSERIDEMLHVLLAYKKQASLEIRDVYFYPKYPYYLPYALSADRGGNFALIHTNKQYAITADGDWHAMAKASEEGNKFSKITFHVTNDIVDDPGNKFMIGMVAGGFAGTFDGHGYTITCARTETVSTARHVGGLFAGTGYNTGAVIKNLGVKGTFNVSVVDGSDVNYGVAGLIGIVEYGTKIYGCWNEATVTVVDNSTGKSKGNYSIAGLAGRCYGSIYDCYNIGDVNGLERASGICDWINNANSQVYNVFHNAELNSTKYQYVVDNNDGKYYGIYAVEGTVTELGFKNNLIDSESSGFVEESLYTSGELAYMLNSRKKTYASERVYFTLSEDNKTVLGAADTQARKITIANSGGTVTSTRYGAQGRDYSVGSGTVYVTTRNGKTYYTNGKFVVPGYDLTLTVSSQSNLSKYVEYYNYWNGKRATYFDVVAKANMSHDSFDDQIDSLEAAYNNGLVDVDAISNMNRSAFDALKGQYRSGDNGMPHAEYVESHTDAPVGYRLHTVDDMYALSEHTALFSAARSSGAETIIKFQNDIDMALFVGEDFYINSIDATIDGNGKTLYNFTCQNTSTGKDASIGPAVFRNFNGDKICDLTIDGLLTSGGYAVAGLIGDTNSPFELNNITIRNSRVRKAFVDSDTGSEFNRVAMGMLVGRIWDGGGVVKITDCVIENCCMDFTLYELLDANLGAPMINIGFVVGQSYENTIIDGVIVRNNTILVNGHDRKQIGSVGYVVGEPYTDSNETILVRNSGIYGNNTITDPLVNSESEMKYGLAANATEGKYGEVAGWVKIEGTFRMSNVQVAGNDAGAANNAKAVLVAVSQDSNALSTQRVEGELIYWDKLSNPSTQKWYLDAAGTHATVTNAKPHNYETTDNFKYGQSGWKANNDIDNSVNTLEASHTLRKWTVLHSDTYLNTKNFDDLNYPTIAKDGEEPIHRVYFENSVGNTKEAIKTSYNLGRYSDSEKRLIIRVDEIDNPTAAINDVPWEGITGNVVDYVPENLTKDITIKSVVANYPYMSLSLDTDIAVEFYVHVHPDFRNENYQLTTTHSVTWKDSYPLGIADDKDGVLEKGEVVSELHTADAKTYYRIKLPLNANEMWRTFKVQVTDLGNTESATYKALSGSTQIPNQKWTKTSNIGTIKDYVRAILQGAATNQEYAEASELVAAMLNYGNEVRDCFWLGGDDRPWIDELKDYGYPLYNYENMMDNVFTDKAPNINYKELFQSYKSKGSKKDDALSYVGSSLLFDTNIAIRHYFKLNGTASAAGVEALNAAYEAAVRKSDGTLIMDLEYQYSGDQKMYYVEYRNIEAQDMDEMFLFTFSHGAYNVDTNYVVKLNYGVYSYGYVTWNKSTAERFILAALYEYCNQAKDYLSWKKAV